MIKLKQQKCTDMPVGRQSESELIHYLETKPKK